MRDNELEMPIRMGKDPFNRSVFTRMVRIIFTIGAKAQSLWQQNLDRKESCKSLFGQALIETYHSRLPIRFENLGLLRRTEFSGATTVREVCRRARSSSDQSISAHAANSGIKQDFDPSASHIVLAFEKGFCLVEPETRLPIPRKSEFGGGNVFPTDGHGVRAVIHFHF